MIKNRFPNQYKVVIKKEKVNQNGGKPYFLAYQETIEAAAQKLSGNEFKLYIYLLSNRDGYEDFYSPDYFGKAYGISADTARKLFQKLIEKGFLVKTAPHDCDFYEAPQKKLNIQPPRRRIVDDNGEIFDVTYKELSDELLKNDFTKEEVNEIWNNGRIL